ncbi:MAG: hypothetical protein C0506_02990 [Anaerolinea sp.]|nr:hypothetical protein [Anaerolinea sp.]
MIAKRASHRTRIGKRNQVTIPAALLRELGVVPGDLVEVSLDAQCNIAIAKALDPFERLAELRAEFKRDHPGAPPAPSSDDELEGVIREARRVHGERASADDARIMRESREPNG